MTWAKVDDRLHGHPKARKAGPAAMGLWVMAMSHCMAYLTGGKVSKDDVESLVGRHADGHTLAAKLVEVGLWETDGVGYQFHDWEKYQTPAKKIKIERERARKRKEKSRTLSRVVSRRDTVDGHGPVTLPNPNPNPNPNINTEPPLPPVETSTVEPQPTAGAPPATPADPAPKSKARKPKGQRLTPTSDEQAVFDHWVLRMKKTGRTVFADERIAPVRARFAAGFTADDLRQAIDGCAKDPFSMGQNDRGIVFNDLSLICRDAAHVEKFMAIEAKNRPRPVRLVPPEEPDEEILTGEALDQKLRETGEKWQAFKARHARGIDGR